MKWNVVITARFVPMEPGDEYLRRAAIQELARMAMQEMGLIPAEKAEPANELEQSETSIDILQEEVR